MRRRDKDQIEIETLMTGEELEERARFKQIVTIKVLRLEDGKPTYFQQKRRDCDG
jgi:hypothetical protein